ncbi:hypothetical protein QTP88_001786 [Uroleucon formosanum]
MSQKEKAKGTKYINGHVGKRRALVCEGRTDGAQPQAHGSGKGVYVISIGLVNNRAKINIPRCYQGSANLLLDTGADLNLIKLDTLSDNVKINTDQTYSLQGIQKTPVNTMGSVLLNIHVGNSTQPNEFQVIPIGFPIPQDGIMGRPLLEQLKAVIDCNQGTLTWDIPTNKITVPPHSQVVIPVCTTNVVGDNQDVLIHSQQLAEDLFCGNVLNTVQNGQVLICIVNSREEPIQMEPPHLDELSHQLLDETQAKTIFNIRKTDNRQNRIDLLQRTLRLDHTNKEERKSVENICNEYADIFHLEGDTISCKDAMQHEIKIPQGALPIHQRPYRLPYSQQSEINKQVNELLQDGVNTTSDSPWNAPLLSCQKRSTLWENKIPRNPREVKSFLGLAGYYRKFVKDFSQISKPLTTLLKKEARFEWTDLCQHSFETLKGVLTTEPLLQHPDFSQPFLITTDASNSAIGAVLSQGPYAPTPMVKDGWNQQKDYLMLTVLKVKDADKKSYLIAYIGSEAYSQLKDACLPEEPQLKSYDELVSKLEEIYSPRRLVGESTREYITALKKLSSFCVFGSFLNDALRDRLIVGISDESCQRELLGIDSLTFEEACKIALDSELVCNQTQQINNKSQINFVNNGKNVSRQTHSSSKSELKRNENSGGKSWSGKSSKPGQKNGQSIQHGSQSSRSLKFGKCYRCGRKHDVRMCPAREWECFSCKVKGHTSKMCKTKIKNNLESIDLVNNVSQNSGGNPLVIKIKVNNKLIPFEVDSGVSVLVMPIKYFNMYFNNSCKLEKKKYSIKFCKL